MTDLNQLKVYLY